MVSTGAHHSALAVEPQTPPLRRDFTRRSRPGQVASVASSRMVVRARPSGLRVSAGAVLSEVRVPESDSGESPADRASIEAFLRRCAEEQRRLRAEIDAARQRIERAATAAEGRASLDQLAALVTQAHDELTRLEREHRQAVQSTRDRAMAEATRLLDDARRRAEEVHARGRRLLEEGA